MKIFNKIALRRFYVLFAKEGLQIIRDPSNILIAFVLPLILLFLFGYAMSLDSTKVKVALVTEANYSPTTNSFVKSFMDSRFFDVVTITPDRHYAASLIATSKIRGIVVVPQHFEQILLYAQSEPALQIITDATVTNMANFINGYVNGVWNTWLVENRYIPQPIVVVEPNFLYNQTLESKNFLVPGSITIILTLIGTMLTALVVAKEWEHGTMEAIMATPIGVLDIIISKLIPYLMLGLGSVIFCLIVAFFVFHIPFKGSFYLLFLVSTVYLCAALGLGLVISALSKDQFAASQAAIVSAFMPSMMLSGFVYEIKGMPKIVQFITHFVPAKYFIECLRTIFLVGDAWRVILPRLAVITFIATLFLTITVVKTKKRIT